MKAGSGNETTFPRLVDNLFEDKQDFVANYICDPAIFSQDWKTHMEHLRQVFTILKDAKLTLRNDKCLLGADYFWATQLVVGKFNQ